MAGIKSIDMHNGTIDIMLSINRDEYKVLKHHMANLVILPCGKNALNNYLTTGKLGNSNRIMLPKKMLERFEIGKVEKKVPSSIFYIDGDAFLLIKIKKSELGVPKFEEDWDESHNRHEKA